MSMPMKWQDLIYVIKEWNILFSKKYCRWASTTSPQTWRHVEKEKESICEESLICYYYLRGLFNAYFICNKSQEGIILILSHQLTVYFLPFSHYVKKPTINRWTATTPFAKKILCHRPMNSTRTDPSFPQETVAVSFLLLMLVTSNIQAALLRTYLRNVMCL